MPVTERQTLRSFLDSNVVLYLLSADEAKAAVAEDLLRNKPVISVQVLNEVTRVCTRKLAMPWVKVDAFIELVKTLCEVVPLTVEPMTGRAASPGVMACPSTMRIPQPAPPWPDVPSCSPRTCTTAWRWRRGLPCANPFRHGG